MERTLDQAILGLLERHAIGDQDAFLHLLARQGHEVNQSTLSRHLKKLLKLDPAVLCRRQLEK